MEENTTTVVKKTRRTRKYLGVMPSEGPKEDRAFNKAHLNAYLVGRKWFYYGFYTDEIGQRKRQIHIVKQDLFNV